MGIVERGSWEYWLIIELRKTMLIEGLEFRPVATGAYELFTKDGLHLDGPHGSNVWAGRVFENKKHNAVVAADAKNEGEK